VNAEEQNLVRHRPDVPERFDAAAQAVGTAQPRRMRPPDLWRTADRDPRT
jgi:hypothetical protein